MEEKAQANFELLLIIVGSIVVVTIVSLFIKSTVNTLNQTANTQTQTNP